MARLGDIIVTLKGGEKFARQLEGLAKKITKAKEEFIEAVAEVSPKQTIIVNPAEWDEGVIDCPFADQDSICLRAQAEGMSVMYCHHCGLHDVSCMDKCPLEDGSVEVSLAATKKKSKCENQSAGNN